LPGPRPQPRPAGVHQLPSSSAGTGETVAVIEAFNDPHAVSDPYAHTSSLFDITSGSDGNCSPSYLCQAGTGYDGPTGWGSPDGTAAFTG
jgi:hypothetical protein